MSKNGGKCKQIELYVRSRSGEEIEVNEGKLSEVVGVVNFSEPEACTDGQDKDVSVMVGVTFREKVESCILADPYVVSGWVKMELGAVESVYVLRSGLVIIVCVSARKRASGRSTPHKWDNKKREPLKGVVARVAVHVNVDQLKGKIPGVWDAHRLLHRRQGGVSGETEGSLSVLLSFDVECPTKGR